VRVNDIDAVGGLHVRQREAGALGVAHLQGDMASLLLPLLLSPILPFLSTHSHPSLEPPACRVVVRSRSVWCRL
jgi:hypothetical protein